MKFQISAPWIWGFQLEIDDDELKNIKHNDLHTYINKYAKSKLDNFFRTHNLMDIVDFISTIKRFSITENFYNDNNESIVYLCYHKDDTGEQCCC